MRTIEAAHRMRPSTTRSGRTSGARALRRGAAAVAAVVALVALSGCYGPVTTTGIDLTVDCHYGIFDDAHPPPPDIGTSVIHISLDAPTWANPGATIPLNNPTERGGPQPTATDPGVELIGVTLNGLNAFAVVVLNNGTTTLANTFGAFIPGEVYGSATTGVNAPPHGVATVDFTDFQWVQIQNGQQYVADCQPIAGQPTRLATIQIRGDHNY